MRDALAASVSAHVGLEQGREKWHYERRGQKTKRVDRWTERQWDHFLATSSPGALTDGLELCFVRNTGGSLRIRLRRGQRESTADVNIAAVVRACQRFLVSLGVDLVLAADLAALHAARKKPVWTSEARAAAAERMRVRQAARKREDEPTVSAVPGPR